MPAPRASKAACEATKESDAEGGRLLLPLECFDPSTGRNTCGTGSIAVADPVTLQWRYYVKLDPADLAKAMWAEVSPDGRLLWTSAGDDLLAYSVVDISASNAAPTGPRIRPVRRLPGAVPPSRITGATFHAGRLFIAGQGTGRFQVWSIDLATGDRRLEIERTYVGESEGLDTASALGGVLHWQVQPFNREGRPPTFGHGHGTLVHFVPAPGAPPPKANTPSEPAPAQARDARAPAVRASRACTSRGLRARVKVDEPVRSVVVSLNGRPMRTTNRASFTVRLPARRLRRGPNRLTVVATDAAGNRTRRSFRLRACPVQRRRFSG